MGGGRAGHEAELLGVFVLGDDEKGYWTGKGYVGRDDVIVGWWAGFGSTRILPELFYLKQTEQVYTNGILFVPFTPMEFLNGWLKPMA